MVGDARGGWEGGGVGVAGREEDGEWLAITRRWWSWRRSNTSGFVFV
jgi:hypothetical protein